MDRGLTSLTLRGVQRADSGAYNVKLTNSEGECEAAFNIVVKGIEIDLFSQAYLPSRNMHYTTSICDNSRVNNFRFSWTAHGHQSVESFLKGHSNWLETAQRRWWN